MEAERGQERAEREIDDALARAREDKVNDGLEVGATIKKCKTKLRRAPGARVQSPGEQGEHERRRNQKEKETRTAALCRVNIRFVGVMKYHVTPTNLILTPY